MDEGLFRFCSVGELFDFASVSTIVDQSRHTFSACFVLLGADDPPQNGFAIRTRLLLEEVPRLWIGLKRRRFGFSQFDLVALFI